MKDPQKIKNRVTIGPSNFSPGDLAKKLENINSQKCKYPYVHCSMNHGAQDMETTEVSFDKGWIKKMWSMSTVEYDPP